MENQDSKISILIVGATGTLGTLITKHCLAKPNLFVNILVRNPQKSPDLVAEVEKAGGKVIKADATKVETLKGVTKGMHTVIIALDDNAAAIGQPAIIQDCLENKVERIVPAEFACNMRNFSKEEVESSSAVRNANKAQEYLKTIPLKHLNINTGLYLDWMLTDPLAKEIGYWGDASNKVQMTTYEDTAKVVAAAVARKDRVGDVTFVANQVTMDELAEIYNKVRGTNLKAKKWGSYEDLKAKTAKLMKEGDSFAILDMLIFDKRARFEKVDNDEFPEVQGTTVEEYLKQNPDIQIAA